MKTIEVLNLETPGLLESANLLGPEDETNGYQFQDRDEGIHKNGTKQARIDLGHDIDHCIYCGKDDFIDPDSNGNKPAPRTLVYCSACLNSCTHVECHQQAVNDPDDEFAQKSGLWFCSKVSLYLIRLRDSYTLGWVQTLLF